jgi:hypothetical protein
LRLQAARPDFGPNGPVQSLPDVRAQPRKTKLSRRAPQEHFALDFSRWHQTRIKGSVYFVLLDVVDLSVATSKQLGLRSNGRNMTIREVFLVRRRRNIVSWLVSRRVNPHFRELLPERFQGPVRIGVEHTLRQPPEHPTAPLQLPLAKAICFVFLGSVPVVTVAFHR